MSKYYMHDLTPFSPVAELEKLLDEMRTDPEPDERLAEQIADMEWMLQESREMDAALAAGKTAAAAAGSGIAENQPERTRGIT